MKETSTSSISFVITAIYTCTFGNAVYRLVSFDEAAVALALRPNVEVVHVGAAVTCIVMALRFFFGNNSYVAHIFEAPLPPVARLYHLGVIILQSLLLMASSFLILNPPTFILTMTVLFGTEVLWYLLCWMFLRTAVRDQDGHVQVDLLWNEVANLVMVIAGVVAFEVWPRHPMVGAVVFAIVFVGNVIVDLRVNLGAYMGDRAVAT